MISYLTVVIVDKKVSLLFKLVTGGDAFEF